LFLIGTGKVRQTNTSNTALLTGSRLNITVASVTTVIT
jgi:hypothetical protein